ncbi:MAG TPA: ABC transporter ATP-binding protein [Rhodospirillales bacterium]|nr:ABC transporter ATP-binding protein [Rhodospirillales bacterium]
MNGNVLRAVDVTKRFGGVVACDRVSLALERGEIHALIGPNGAGKTTFLNLLSGELAADAGRILLDGTDITRLPTHRRARLGLARSFQITSIFPSMSVLENVSLAVQAHAGSSFRFLGDAGRDPTLVEPARRLLEELGLADRADMPAALLAHGQKRLLELAMTLAGEPELLLLDEPLAGLGPEESRRMVELLAALRQRITMLLVEHDMDAVFRLADRVTVLVYGRVIASGDPERVRGDPDVRAAYLGEEAG